MNVCNKKLAFINYGLDGMHYNPKDMDRNYVENTVLNCKVWWWFWVLPTANCFFYESGANDDNCDCRWDIYIIYNMRKDSVAIASELLGTFLEFSFTTVFSLYCSVSWLLSFDCGLWWTQTTIRLYICNRNVDVEADVPVSYNNGNL